MLFILLVKVAEHFFVGSLESDSHICRSRWDVGRFDRQAESPCYLIIPGLGRMDFLQGSTVECVVTVPGLLIWPGRSESYSYPKYFLVQFEVCRKAVLPGWGSFDEASCVPLLIVVCRLHPRILSPAERYHPLIKGLLTFQNKL